MSRGKAKGHAPRQAEVGDFPRPLLHALHLLTPDGALNADARRKLKQIEHFLNFLRPVMEDVLSRFNEPQVLDAGAGKAYLGLLLAHRHLSPAGRGRLLAVEARADLAARAADIAREAGLAQVELVAASLAEAPLPERLHLVVALHACDTATDDALALAIARGADHVAVVPCCQAEVARLLAGAAPPEPALAALWGHAWHRREFGAHLTNVVRALVLEAHGYQVTVTELAGWEHSLKNELILGRRVHRENRRARARLDALLASLGGVEPSLVRQLRALGGPTSESDAPIRGEDGPDAGGGLGGGGVEGGAQGDG